jgi:hypothetical protein
VRRESSAVREFLSDANRRAIGRNLARMYPVDRGPGFEELLGRMNAVERRPKFRRS